VSHNFKLLVISRSSFPFAYSLLPYLTVRNNEKVIFKLPIPAHSDLTFARLQRPYDTLKIHSNALGSLFLCPISLVPYK
jgi:hypothetical protein